MVKIHQLALLLLSVVFIAGCTSIQNGVGTLSDLSNSYPEIRQFLAENPNSNLKTEYWNSDVISDNIQWIKSECGKDVPIKSYYVVKADSERFDLLAFIDSSKNVLECAIKRSNTGEFIATITETQQETVQQSFVQSRCTGFQYFTFVGHVATPSHYTLNLINGHRDAVIKYMNLYGSDDPNLGSFATEVTPSSKVPATSRFQIDRDIASRKKDGESFTYTVEIGYDSISGIFGNVDRATCTGTMQTTDITEKTLKQQLIRQPKKIAIEAIAGDEVTVRNIGTSSLYYPGEIVFYVNNALEKCANVPEGVQLSIPPGEQLKCTLPACTDGTIVKVTAPGNEDSEACWKPNATPLSITLKGGQSTTIQSDSGTYTYSVTLVGTSSTTQAVVRVGNDQKTLSTSTTTYLGGLYITVLSIDHLSTIDQNQNQARLYIQSNDQYGAFTLKTLPMPFIISNGTGTIIVVGSNPSSEEYVAFDDVRQRLIADGGSAITTKRDVEVTAFDKSTKNMILIGNPAVNSLVKVLADDGKTWTREKYIQEGYGTAIVQIVNDAFVQGKTFLILSGHSSSDVRTAANIFNQYNLYNLEGTLAVFKNGVKV